MRTSLWLALIIASGCNGRGCTPMVDDDVITETGTRETGLEETGVEGPCPVPEVEPNGSESQALTLPLETIGCGAFAEELDLDYWLIEFEGNGWLSVRVDARTIGSPADPAMLISSEQGLAAQVGNSTTGEDIHLVFPTGPDRFQTMLAEASSNQSGQDHTYEVLASWAKAPVSYNTDEFEPNDAIDEPQRLQSGDRVFGWLHSALDLDWYVVSLNAGKQTLRVDVDAWEFGSAGNFYVVILDGEGQRLGTWYTGEIGFEQDPYVEVTVPGNQDLVIRVAEESERSSAMAWYVVDVRIEESD